MTTTDPTLDPRKDDPMAEDAPAEANEHVEIGVDKTGTIDASRAETTVACVTNPKFRALLWNVCNLGGGFGKPAHRDDDVIAAMARLIADSDAHFVALLELKKFAGSTGTKPKLPTEGKYGDKLDMFRGATGSVVRGGAKNDKLVIQLRGLVCTFIYDLIDKCVWTPARRREPVVDHPKLAQEAIDLIGQPRPIWRTWADSDIQAIEDRLRTGQYEAIVLPWDGAKDHPRLETDAAEVKKDSGGTPGEKIDPRLVAAVKNAANDFTGWWDTTGQKQEHKGVPDPGSIKSQNRDKKTEAATLRDLANKLVDSCTSWTSISTSTADWPACVASGTGKDRVETPRASFAAKTGKAPGTGRSDDKVSIRPDREEDPTRPRAYAGKARAILNAWAKTAGGAESSNPAASADLQDAVDELRAQFDLFDASWRFAYAVVDMTRRFLNTMEVLSDEERNTLLDEAQKAPVGLYEYEYFAHVEHILSGCLPIRQALYDEAMRQYEKREKEQASAGKFPGLVEFRRIVDAVNERRGGKPKYDCWPPRDALDQAARVGLTKEEIARLKNEGKTEEETTEAEGVEATPMETAETRSDDPRAVCAAYYTKTESYGLLYDPTVVSIKKGEIQYATKFLSDKVKFKQREPIVAPATVYGVPVAFVAYHACAPADEHKTERPHDFRSLVALANEFRNSKKAAILLSDMNIDTRRSTVENWEDAAATPTPDEYFADLTGQSRAGKVKLPLRRQGTSVVTSRYTEKTTGSGVYHYHACAYDKVVRLSKGDAKTVDGTKTVELRYGKQQVISMPGALEPKSGKPDVVLTPQVTPPRSPQSTDDAIDPSDRDPEGLVPHIHGAALVEALWSAFAQPKAKTQKERIEYYTTAARRLSDHDPVLAEFWLQNATSTGTAATTSSGKEDATRPSAPSASAKEPRPVKVMRWPDDLKDPWNLETVQKHRDWLFVFSESDERRLASRLVEKGQAVIAAAPNAIGIRTCPGTPPPTADAAKESEVATKPPPTSATKAEEEPKKADAEPPPSEAVSYVQKELAGLKSRVEGKKFTFLASAPGGGPSADSAANTGGEAPPKRPLGIVNGGNACYANSVLQLLFAVDVQRNFAIDWDGGAGGALQAEARTCLTRLGEVGRGTVQAGDTRGLRVALFGGAYASQHDAHEALTKILDAFSVDRGINTKTGHEELLLIRMGDTWEAKRPSKMDFVVARTDTYDDKKATQISRAEIHSVLLLEFPYEAPPSMDKVVGDAWDVAYEGGSGPPFKLEDGTPVKTTAQKTRFLGTAPERLLVQLKRFRKPALDAVLTKNVIDVTGASTMKVPGVEPPYELRAFVTHSGDLEHGHYWAYVKRRDGWYKFDDDTVTGPEPPAFEAELKQGYLFYYARPDVELPEALRAAVGGPPAADRPPPPAKPKATSGKTGGPIPSAVDAWKTAKNNAVLWDTDKTTLSAYWWNVSKVAGWQLEDCLFVFGANVRALKLGLGNAELVKLHTDGKTYVENKRAPAGTRASGENQAVIGDEPYAIGLPTCTSGASGPPKGETADAVAKLLREGKSSEVPAKFGFGFAFHEVDHQKNMAAISVQIEAIKDEWNSGRWRKVIFPYSRKLTFDCWPGKAGFDLGTSLAAMPFFAPTTFQEMQKALDGLVTWLDKTARPSKGTPATGTTGGPSTGGPSTGTGKPDGTPSDPKDGVAKSPVIVVLTALDGRGSGKDGYKHEDGKTSIPTHLIPVRISATVPSSDILAAELERRTEELNVAFREAIGSLELTDDTEVQVRSHGPLGDPEASVFDYAEERFRDELKRLLEPHIKPTKKRKVVGEVEEGAVKDEGENADASAKKLKPGGVAEDPPGDESASKPKRKADRDGLDGVTTEDETKKKVKVDTSNDEAELALEELEAEETRRDLEELAEAEAEAENSDGET